MAIDRAHDECGIVDISTKDAFAQIGTAKACKTIYNPLAVTSNGIGVENIFGPKTNIAVICIFAVSGVAAIFGVVAVPIIVCHARHDRVQFFELREERPARIPGTPKARRIPCVTPPFINGVNRKRLFSVIKRYDVFSRQA